MILKELRICYHLSQEQLASRIEVVGHISGFTFCCLGLINEAALVGGLLMLSTAYLYHWLKYQGDKYGIWYEYEPAKAS